ncbi:resistance protein [Trifolium pratense]|uniref:Resistance protein n=1 Tax=Trifolium pratense TaxID=57577 RepID=A0A2K3M313_TRIPR|nr:putative disease resistance protein RGA3 [Trifolium pratense]PNX85178.1 resistance protein [Trifolium pratense]
MSLVYFWVLIKTLKKAFQLAQYTIEAMLKDDEEKQFTYKAIKDWLQKLKDVANVRDDILDKCATEALEFEYEGLKCGLTYKVQTSFLSSFHPKHGVFRYKIAKKMKRMRLDESAEEKASRFYSKKKILACIG